tara:strand:- start:1098 stop:1712 length:615 start_codon:yes stop_codon:yes gene_type:complete
MSFLTCDCPLSAAISDITAAACGDNFGQIQKVIVQRKGYAFDGTAGKDITLLADWQTVFAAADATKAQITPFLSSAIIAGGEKITNGGGDNSTLNGEAELVGMNPSAFTSMMKSLTSAQIAELATFNCEKALVVYFVNESGKIICKDLTGGSYTGITISSFFAGEKSNNGYATLDENPLDFTMKKGWSCDYAIVTPVFDPLEEL